jgi:hypothetical protein
VVLLESLLENGYLYLLLIDLVTKKDDFLIFVVGIHFRQPFQASFAGSSGESGSYNGRFNDQCNSMGDDVQVLAHKAIQTSSKTSKSQLQREYDSIK